MGWRGAGGLGAAEIGVFYFFGGLLMVIASFFEFFLGHTFQLAVFGSFGAFWLSFAATLTPYFNAATAYQPQKPETALANPTFNATFAYFPLYMGLLCFIYFIASLKTNLVLMLTFLLLVPGLGCLSGVFFKAAEGVAATSLQTAAGGCFFAVCILCWYLLVAQILASVAFPVQLPVGDLSQLSTIFRGRLNKKRN
ncbi:uncharacterized protein A1O5_09180 [Cladophialophora psammophila CBS 110553]|uniref:Protein alcS n=1 Tax=Cladophialophora psammophila CBS 110553 TaxID=1182543 RepID=W9XBN1_9EURO|nr:uncharacterized protein A1O5_09180 [Cladophialophora psammophila CBS 110553]EXJ67834.1 hypothetical protein A1O5_09180 [Cladophialophora psammophila CBS 110553]